MPCVGTEPTDGCALSAKSILLTGPVDTGATRIVPSLLLRRYTFSYWAPTYFQQVFEISPTATGAYLASTHLFSVAGGFVAPVIEVALLNAGIAPLKVVGASAIQSSGHGRSEHPLGTGRGR